MRRWEPVGVYYCTVHEGVMNEDEDVCDFARMDARMFPYEVDEDERPCNRLQLAFRKKKRRGFLRRTLDIMSVSTNLNPTPRKGGA